MISPSRFLSCSPSFSTPSREPPGFTDARRDAFLSALIRRLILLLELVAGNFVVLLEAGVVEVVLTVDTVESSLSSFLPGLGDITSLRLSFDTDTRLEARRRADILLPFTSFFFSPVPTLETSSSVTCFFSTSPFFGNSSSLPIAPAPISDDG